MLLDYLITICFCLTFHGTGAATELFHNADFESTSFSGNWVAIDCTMTSRTDDKYHGTRSVMVSHRHHTWSAARQTFHVTQGKNYVVKMYFKLLNLPSGHAYAEVKLNVALTVNGNPTYFGLAKIPMQQLKFGWTEISGDFHAQNGATDAGIYIEIPDISVNYLVDFASAQELPHNSHWMSDAQKRINSIRKAPVSFKLPHGVNAHGISIELVQKNRNFAFGTAVVAASMTDPSQKGYQDFVYNNFEWAVFENALKWRQMEWTENHVNLDKPLNAISALRSHGIKVRGHNMFWDVEQFIPQWLKGKSQTELLSSMKGHVTQVISRTKGKLEHWDVNNENLHGDWFERHTRDPDITEKMFQWIHQQEPNVKLFLNDYEVINQPFETTALRNQALHLIKEGIPVYGLGLQGHFFSHNIDIDILKPNAAGQKYLDLFHKTWKTYFVHNVNPGSTVNTRAFLGDYLLNIKRNGHLIHQENFNLDKSGKDITIHLTNDHHGVSQIVFG